MEGAVYRWPEFMYEVPPYIIKATEEYGVPPMAIGTKAWKFRCMTCLQTAYFSLRGCNRHVRLQDIAIVNIYKRYAKSLIIAAPKYLSDIYQIVNAREGEDILLTLRFAPRVLDLMDYVDGYVSLAESVQYPYLARKFGDGEKYRKEMAMGGVYFFEYFVDEIKKNDAWTELAFDNMEKMVVWACNYLEAVSG